MFKQLDCVALTHDLPAAGLRAGDVGTIVEVEGPGVLDVEFVLGSGRTQALVSLGDANVRPLGDTDLLAVRSVTPAR